MRETNRQMSIALAVVAALSATAASAAIDTLAIGPDCVPDMAIDCPFSIDFTASGGVPPYSFALGGGTLPPGMTLDAGGTMSGTPTTSGTYGVTISARDSNGDSGSRDYELRVMEHWNIVLGAGLALPNPNLVKAVGVDGADTGVEFLAYGANQWGTNVAAGFISYGPGVTTTADEIVTGPGPGPVYGPHVRGWFRDGSAMAKVSYFAYGTLKYGVNLAVGDIDGDRWDEIVTGAGNGSVFGPHVRGWNYDNTVPSAIAKVNFFAYSTLKYGVNVAVGDIDGDCIDEILTGPGPGSIFTATVRGFNYDGMAVTAMSNVNFNAFSTNYGVNLAAGDVDADHFDEIVATPGPGPTNGATFIGYNYDGNSVSMLPGYDVTPFPTMYGGRAGMACVGDPLGAIVGGMDLLAAPGPDPTAGADLKVYAYTGSSLIEIVPSTPIGLPGTGYGLNPTGARLGL